MRLPEDNIIVLERLIEGLRSDQQREADVFQSVIDQLNELRSLQVLINITGWTTVEAWKRELTTLNARPVYAVINNVTVKQIYYRPKTDKFYPTKHHKEPMFESVITWVRSI